MKNLYKISFFSPYVQQETSVQHSCGLGESFRVWALRLMSVHSETLFIFKIPARSWWCCRWLHRWGQYVSHVSLSPCFQILCLFGNLSSKSQVKKERKSKLYVDIESFLITHKTGLVENRFKVLKCQCCYAHGLNYFSNEEETWKYVQIFCLSSVT